jgi:hypothetical protein
LASSVDELKKTNSVPTAKRLSPKRRKQLAEAAKAKQQAGMNSN